MCKSLVFSRLKGAVSRKHISKVLISITEYYEGCYCYHVRWTSGVAAPSLCTQHTAPAVECRAARAAAHAPPQLSAHFVHRICISCCCGAWTTSQVTWVNCWLSWILNFPIIVFPPFAAQHLPARVKSNSTRTPVKWGVGNTGLRHSGTAHLPRRRWKGYQRPTYGIQTIFYMYKYIF